MVGPTITRRVAFETARLALARVRVDTASDLEEVARRATRICAEALDIERVGIWLFEESDQLACLTMYVKSTGKHGQAPPLGAQTYPTYRAALESRRVIVADDAAAHAATRELGDDYLAPLGITSMLDAPVFRHGQLFGVLCHEHVGPARRWTPDEIEFASAIAEVVALVFEQVDRARSEAELRENLVRIHELERLREVRRFAQSVAHDFNNVLLSAMTLTSLAQDGPTTADLRDLREVLEIGRRLAGELQRFSQLESRTEPPRSTPALARLRDMTTVLGLLLRPNATLAADVDGEEVEVGLSPLELEQLVLNLSINARDAMASRGGNVSLVARGGSQLLLTIRDDGAGMTDDVKARLFEPYFTTKASGTGMGLVVVVELVRKAGGTIEIDSTLGRGTTVRVTLPRC